MRDLLSGKRAAIPLALAPVVKWVRRDDQLRRSRREVDRVTIDGSLDRRDATVRFFRGGTTRAVATVFRDWESLAAEVEL